MSEHVQTCINLFRFKIYELLQFMRFSKMSKHVESCLKLFRFNMIWIVMIHMIWSVTIHHVWTLKQTCLNLFRLNLIWINTIHIILKHVWTCLNMSKLVQNQYDMNWFYSKACLNLFVINMIWIDTILKDVKTWNEHMMKYTKIE